MDGSNMVGFGVGLCSLVGAGVAIGLKVRRPAVVPPSIVKDIEAHDHKIRNLENWRLALPDSLNVNFARRETIAAELDAIKMSLKRIEAHQEMMAQRFMNGGAGSA